MLYEEPSGLALQLVKVTDATTKGTWGRDIQNYQEERSIAKTRGKTVNENLL